MADKKPEDGGLFGWRNWTWPDEWTQIKRDRTPIAPDSGKFMIDEDLSDPKAPLRKNMVLHDDRNPVRHPERSIAYDLMKTWQPAFKCILTDMGAQVVSGQGGVCADFELNAMECIEYYGAKQGITACKDWYDDYMECQSGAKQWLRIRAMFKKRHIDNHLEYLQGKRTWDETYEKPPKHHAYLEPWYDEKYSHSEGPMQV